MNKRFPRTLLSFGLALLLVMLTLLPPFGGSAVYAQNLHPACLNDQGNPAIPRIAQIYAQVLVLNFNHAPNTTTTTGCVGTRMTTGSPVQVVYNLVTCTLVNNLNNVAVGNGAAPFDGTFWVECPAWTLYGGSYIADFYVNAKAEFYQTSFKGVQWYTLMEHPDITIKTNIDAGWHPTIESTYGKTTFTNYDSATNVTGTVVQMKSEVSAAVGSHKINGTVLAPSQPGVPVFEFDGSQPIVIGKSMAGRDWTLHIIIIDPPSAYS